MRRAWATGLLTASCIATGCGGQTEGVAGGISGASGIGGANSFGGGNYSMGGTGAAATTDPASQYCGGLLAGYTCSQTTGSVSAPSTSSCDMELRSTPTNPLVVQVVKDCQLVPLLPHNSPVSDGGVVDGFYIDYSRSPAHLILTGSYCDAGLASGASQLDVIEGCYIPS